MAEVALAGAIAVLKQAVSIFGNLAAEEGARLFKVKENIEWVEREMGNIQAFLKRNDSIGEDDQDPVEANLAKDIRVLAYDVEDIVIKYFPLIASKEKKVRCCSGFLKRKDAALNFVKEIEVIRRRVEDIRRARETYGTTVHNNDSSRLDMIWEQRKLFLNLEESKIVGFDGHIETLVSKVFDPELQHLPVVSIVGDAGLGKTTLAKKVYKTVKPRFRCSAMVYVSQTPNFRQLLLEVATQVGLEKNKCKENLELNLRGHLEDKRYVILFDDIWDIQTWDYLRICIPNNCTNGSKIIVTSRKSDVASIIGTVGSLYPLEPLKEDDSWELFRDLVIRPLELFRDLVIRPLEKTSDSRGELETTGRRIVDKCGGVPLAIEAVAGLLRSKEATEYEWKRVEKGMGQDDAGKWSRVQALSYKNLPPELKPCFLYFGFFPEDYEFSATDIINIWVAEGFVQAKRDLELEDVGRDYLNQLVARNMVQVSKRKFDGTIARCRVHDLWHTFCITVGTESSFFSIDERTHGNNISETRRVRRVIISNRTMREKNLCHQAAKLRAVLLHRYHNSDYKTGHVREVFKRSTCLQVLMIEFDDEYDHTGFLKGIGSLTNLKYFGILLARSYIRIPPDIGNLKGLMTLDLRHHNCVNFPDEIWKMKHLRHILLGPVWRRWGKCKLLSSKLEVYLPNLQTLDEVHYNIFEAEYLRGFPNLRKLGICNPTNSMIKVLSDVNPISDKLVTLKFRLYNISNETPILDLSRYDNICKFSLSLYKGLPPRSIEMPPNLVKLTIVLLDSEDDPIQMWKSLPKLKILKLSFDKYKREEMVCSGGPEAFPQLELLELSPQFFSSPIKFVVEEHAMPKLKRLEWIQLFGIAIQFEVPDRIRTKIFEVKRNYF